MKKKLAIIFLVLKVLNIWAQTNQEIKGRVVDSESQIPIKDAVLSFVGTTQIMQTDSQGNFNFQFTPLEDQILLVTHRDYSDKRFHLQYSPNQSIDLGILTLNSHGIMEMSPYLIDLSFEDISSTHTESDQTTALLQASRDLFERTAAINWSQANFKARGLNSQYRKTAFNGLVMNKLHDGRAQQRNWGGLSEMLKNQEFSRGTAASDHLFGGILGTQHIETRASAIRKGTRFSFSASNAHYTWRPGISYSSDWSKTNWNYAFSLSYRGSEHAYFDGTHIDAPAFFIAIEKELTPSHSINLTAIYTPVKNGKNSPLTDEVSELMGHKYNPNWGWQESKKRNSRIAKIAEPIFILTHYASPSRITKWTNSIAFQFGEVGNSRLGHNGAYNPDPTFYKNLPSYYSGYHDKNGNFIGNTEPYSTLAKMATTYFLDNSQIDWREIYRNNSANGLSKIVLFEDRTKDHSGFFCSNLNTVLTDQLSLDTGINYKQVRSENYSIITDLLGGNAYLDVDPFSVGNQSQSDLNHPDREVGTGDRFGYYYRLIASSLAGFIQFKTNYKGFKTHTAVSLSHNSYQREGIYRNGLYPDNSQGKSAKLNFNNIAFKTGVRRLISKDHTLKIHGAYVNQAPVLNHVFNNARLNNTTAVSVKSENLYSVEGIYILNSRNLRAQFTTYLIESLNANKISYYYADSIDLTDRQENGQSDQTNAFISEILTGINSRHLGIELAVEYTFFPNLQIGATAALGQFFYTNNPSIQLNMDRVIATVDYGTAHLKNYRLSNGPQTATSIFIQYTPAKTWSLGINVNYFDDSYSQIAPILRTDRFVINPESATNSPFENLQKEEVRQILRQEKLKSFLLTHLTAGKSWRLHKQKIGFYASINNVFNISFKTSAFEQARNSNYQEILRDSRGTARSFDSKYTYGYGRNTFVNMYYQF